MMADQLAQAPHIERGIRSAHLMNADEIVTERIGASEIAVLQRAVLGKTPNLDHA
jgi:hypothetical protein